MRKREQHSKGTKNLLLVHVIKWEKPHCLYRLMCLCKDILVCSPSQCVPWSMADHFWLPKAEPVSNISSCSVLSTWGMFSHIFLPHCFLPTGSQPQPGRRPHTSPSPSQHQAVGCQIPNPRAVTHQPQGGHRHRPLDTGKQAPVSSGQHKPRWPPGPCAAGSLCIAAYR